MEEHTLRALAFGAHPPPPSPITAPPSAAPWNRLLAAIVLGAQGRYAAAATALADLRRSRDPLLASLAATTLASHRRQLGGHTAARTLDGEALALVLGTATPPSARPRLGGPSVSGAAPEGSEPASDPQGDRYADPTARGRHLAPSLPSGVPADPASVASPELSQDFQPGQPHDPTRVGPTHLNPTAAPAAALTPTAPATSTPAVAAADPTGPIPAAAPHPDPDDSASDPAPADSTPATGPTSANPISTGSIAADPTRVDPAAADPALVNATRADPTSGNPIRCRPADSTPVNATRADPAAPSAADPDGLDYPGARADALLGLAADNLALGRIAAARRLAARAVAEDGRWRAAVRAGWVGAEIELAAGRPAEAVAPARRAAEIARERGARRHGVKSDIVLGVALSAAGDAEGRAAGLTLVESALKEAEKCELFSLIWVATRVAADLGARHAEEYRFRSREVLHAVLRRVDPCVMRTAQDSPWVPTGSG
ncbi:hypothetical protein [Amycolatopsis sp. PS_44_ISF1]|uniref:hypothetical protein n=1 Tax=Amycolatopsis sp. PS_44_ISF1 TaxID=2974917 RepID=UPI0037BF50D7